MHIALFGSFINVSDEDMKKTLAVVHTPFHLVQLKRYKDCCFADVGQVFYSRHIDFNSLKASFPDSRLVKMPGYDFNARKKLSLSIIKKYRRDTRSILDSIASDDIEQFSKIVIFTDKDVFNQCLMRRIKDGQELILIDEGVGLYKRDALKHYLLKIIYPYASMILFGFRYSYVNQLGVSRRIDRILARLPELIEGSVRQASIEKFPPTYDRMKYDDDGQKIMILTSPFVEDYGISKTGYLRSFGRLYCFLASLGFDIHIKPHPREEQSYEVYGHVMDRSLAIEEVDLRGFRYIINFYSSSVIDLLARGYPAEKILTVNLLGATGMDKIFSGTQLYESIEQFVDSFRIS